ncbi:hypothetical protein K438DRAFT_784239 [Mycena galopus ATCC 62051]|nr:hypothetical protein K438DRAFT_784239 [Mycena galopus ATCC 62051]
MSTSDDAPSPSAASSTEPESTEPEPPRHPLVPPPPAKYTGNIPNTPFFASLISFLLGAVFALGLLAAASTLIHSLDIEFGFGFGLGARPWWATYQLGFFFAAWAAFHWGEYAVTAGWNLEKCSVDSFLLENGSTYHIAHGTAVAEYVLTLYFAPEWKAHPYVSLVGLWFS